MMSVVDEVPFTTTPGRCTRGAGWQTFKVCEQWEEGEGDVSSGRRAGDVSSGRRGKGM